MRFPQTFIDDLRRQSDIVRIVQDYVTLKKTGANWSARCPFHKETKPSFSVNPAKEIFYCFGCQKGGSVFNFIMEIERVTFPEAIKIVAEKSGVPLPKMIDDSRFEARKRESDQVIDLNQWALQWWQDQLQGKAAASVRQYLKQRGLTDETTQAFRLGFAPDSWEALSTHLRQKGASQELLERSGLVVKKDEGGSYDRFRGRLIFPVFDAQGKPIAFGGRTLDPEGEPKYLNSPETPAYTKGRHLFGLHLTRDEMRRQGFAILVEGYLDLIVPYQFGVKNMAASLGTALTPEQVKLIGRFARKVVVNYDGDRAGVQAAKRAIETLLAEDLEVKVLVLPDNADPDDFIRKYGVSEYNRRRGEAEPFIDFLIDQAARDYDVNNPPEKEKAVLEVLSSLSAVRSFNQLQDYCELTMNEFYVLREERPRYLEILKKLWRDRKGRSPGLMAGDIAIEVKESAEPTTAEKHLIKLIVNNTDVRRQALPELQEPNYQWLPTASLFQAMWQLEQQREKWNFDDLLDALKESSLAHNQLVAAVAEDRPWNEIVPESVSGCLVAIKLASIDRRLQMLASEAYVAQRDNDLKKRDQLSLEQVELTRTRNQLVQHN